MTVKKIYRYLLVAVLLFLAAICITEIFFRSVKLDYCKNIIPYRNGVAVIQEGDVFTTVLYANTEGELIDQIKIPYTNYLTGEIRDYMTLMKDEKENLYSFTSVYHLNGKMSWEVSQCRFSVGVLQKKWQLEAPEGFTYENIDGIVPTVKDGKFYIPWTNETTGEYEIYVYDSSGNGTKMEMEEFLKIYGSLDVYDIAFDKIVEAYPDEVSHFQYIAGAEDEKYTLGYENDGDLIGLYIENGNCHYYEKVTGEWQWKMISHIWILFVICALIVTGIRHLLGLRSSRNLLKQQEVKFVSLSSSIFMISALVTIALMFLISNSIYGDLKAKYEFWITSDCQYAAKYIITSLQNSGDITIENFVPVISAEQVENAVEDFNTLMEQKDKSEKYEFYIMAEWKGELYSIYTKGYDGTDEAENIISRLAVQNFEETIEENRYQRFEDKWYTGLIKYTTVPFSKLSSDEEENINLVVGVSNDAYSEGIYYLSVLPRILMIIIVLGLVLWIIVNLILGFALSRIKRLGSDLKMYGDTGDSQCFKTKGDDEIGQTAHTFRAMAGGIEVHRKDIVDSNSNYTKLLPTGIMQLMGKERITQVGVGEYCEVEALMMLFTFRDKEGITRKEQIREVMKFADKYRGIITHFNRDELYMAVSINWDIDEMMQKFEAEIKEDLGIEMCAVKGSFDVGSAGSEQNAYLTATGSVFRQLLTLKNREKGEVNG